MRQSLPLSRPLRKKDQKTVEFELVQSSELCSIMHEPIDEVRLDFVPAHWSQAHPGHTGARLSCSHMFAVSALVYHWLRNKTVSCPVCRQGPSGKRLKPSAIPKDIRTPLLRKVRTEQRADAQERMAADHAVARALAAVDICHIMFETQDHSFLVLRCETIDDVFHVPDLGAVDRFLDGYDLYRVSATRNGFSYSTTPWIRIGQSLMWPGPASYWIQTLHGEFACIYVIFPESDTDRPGDR